MPPEADKEMVNLGKAESYEKPLGLEVQGRGDVPKTGGYGLKQRLEPQGASLAGSKATEKALRQSTEQKEGREPCIFFCPLTSCRVSLGGEPCWKRVGYRDLRN